MVRPGSVSADDSPPHRSQCTPQAGSPIFAASEDSLGKDDPHKATAPTKTTMAAVISVYMRRTELATDPPSATPFAGLQRSGQRPQLASNTRAVSSDGGEWCLLFGRPDPPAAGAERADRDKSVEPAARRWAPSPRTRCVSDPTSLAVDRE